MLGILRTIDHSFRSALRGEEKLNTVIWWWGATAYFATYFLIDPQIKKIDQIWFDISISFLMIIYFIWHIFVLRRCTPKKPVLTKEEKRRLRIMARKEFFKKFMRKLLLQEPISRWDPVFVSMVIDLLCISHFLTYIIK